MRQIKFRGKRVDNGEWVYGYYWCRANCDHKIYTGRLVTIYNLANTRDSKLIDKEYEVVPETIGQFTGLQDSDGKDIYEDDEIHILDKQGRASICVVKFIDGSFVVTIPTTAYCEYLNRFLGLGRSRVVGNIHDKKGA